MILPDSVLIKRGVILHSTIFEYIDHGKFFVIIGEDEDNYIGLFFQLQHQLFQPKTRIVRNAISVAKT